MEFIFGVIFATCIILACEAFFYKRNRGKRKMNARKMTVGDCMRMHAKGYCTVIENGKFVRFEKD